MQTTKVYGYLVEIENNVAKFFVAPASVYEQSANKNNTARPTVTVTAGDLPESSIPKAGLTNPNLTPVDIPGLKWARNEDGITRSIKLNPAKEASRKMVPGEFYLIEINSVSAPKGVSPGIQSTALVEKPGKVSVQPIEKGTALAVSRALGFHDTQDIMNQYKSVRAQSKRTVDQQKSQGTAPRHTSSDINKPVAVPSRKTILTKNKKKLGSPSTHFSGLIEKAKDQILSGGHTFGTLGTSLEPLLDNVSQEFHPFSDTTIQAKIVPIRIRQDDAALDPEKAETYTRIGYTALHIPPKAINVRNENGLDQVEVLRNDGTLKSIDYNTQVIVNISFTVDGPEQINKVLIPIVDQIKRTPFLPIYNAYLLDTYDIDALVIKNLTVNTIDGLPNAMAVSIVAEPFAWWYLLPENSSFEESFCWPLFKMWCESRSPCIELDSTFTGMMKFWVPNGEALENRLKVEKVYGKELRDKDTNIIEPSFNEDFPGNPAIQLLDEDSQLAIHATQALLSENFGTYKQLDQRLVLMSDGGTFRAAIKFQSARNVYRALQDEAIIAYTDITVSTEGRVNGSTLVSFPPEGQISQSRRRELAQEVLNSTVDSSQQADVGSEAVTSPWFIVERGSAMWPYVIQGIRRPKQEELTPDEYNIFTFGENTVVSNIAMQLSSQTVTQQVQGHRLPGHQCLGTGDTYVTIQGLSHTHEDIQMLTGIVEQVRELARKFRPKPFVTPESGFFIIENEVLQTCGVTKVIPMALTISDVEGYPYTYSWQLDCVAFKESQRNTEAFNSMETVVYDWVNSMKDGVFSQEVKVPNNQRPRNLLIEDVSDPSTLRAWRQSITKLSLSMHELYPDLQLPTKKELDYWIRILKYFYNYGIVSEERNQFLLSKALEGTDLSPDNLAKFLELKESGQSIGFVDPDFYCIPAVDPKELAKNLIDTNFGKGLPSDPMKLDPEKVGIGIMTYTDRFGAQLTKKPGDLPNLGGTGNSKEGNELLKHEVTKLNEYRDKVIEGRYPSNGKTPKSTDPGTLSNPKGDFTYKGATNNHSEFNSYNMYDKGAPRNAGIKQHMSAAKNNFDKIYLVNPKEIGFKDGETKKYTINQMIEKGLKIVGNPQGLDRATIAAIMLRESDAVPSSRDSSDPRYIGLLRLSIQDDIQDGTHKQWLKDAGVWKDGITEKDLLNPYLNTIYGTVIMAGYLKKHGNIYLALAAHRKGSKTAYQMKDGNTNSAAAVTADKYARDVLEMASYLNNSGQTNSPNKLSSQDTNAILVQAGLLEDEIAYVMTAIKNKTLPVEQVKRFYYERIDDLGPSAGSGGRPASKTETLQVIDVEACINKMPAEKCWRSISTKLINQVPRDARELSKITIPSDLGNPSQKTILVYYKYSFLLAKDFVDPTDKGVPIGVNSTDNSTINPSVRDDFDSVMMIPPLVEQPVDLLLRGMFDDFEKKEHNGRLLGAFPTFMVMVVDGGRWLGVEKLWDHFYGGFGVNSIDIVASRKNPVDVATVTFSNFYGRLTALSADVQREKNLTTTMRANNMFPIVGDIRQFFSGSVTKELEERWQQRARQTMLKPGARLHIRMGYGSNAIKLPIRFNGVISEVPVQDRYVQVVALGDGVELIKPFEEQYLKTSNVDGQDIKVFQNTGKAFGIIEGGAGLPPQYIISQLFRPSSDFLASESHGRWETDNPYGITHFGNLDYSIKPHGMGEVGVNLYKATQDPDNTQSSGLWASLVLTGALASLRGETLLGVQVEDASPWDIIEVCRKSVPDFVATVRPFEFRSTLFYGKYWWPYHYEYKPYMEDPTKNFFDWGASLGDSLAQYFKDILNETHSVNERIEGNPDLRYPALMNKKPLTQFHAICTGLNLIGGQIIADSSEIYTNCQTKYFYGGSTTNSIMQHVDDDIFPEMQKTLLLKSGILSGPLDGFSALQPWTTSTAANNFAVTTLRDSVAEMYQGGNVITGDPFIWPLDLVYLYDVSNIMNGLYQVKEVVQTFSMESGYITVVSPDCCVAHAGSRQSSIWADLTEAGHAVCSYHILRMGAGAIVRSVGTERIQATLVGKLLGVPKKGKETVLSAYKKAKKVVLVGTGSPASKIATKEEYIVYNKKVIQAFENIETFSLKQATVDAVEKLKTNKLLSEWGLKLKAALPESPTGRSAKVIAALKGIKQSFKEGAAGVEAVLKGSEEAKVIAQGGKVGRTVLKAGNWGSRLSLIGGEAATGIGIPLALLQVGFMILLGSAGEWIGSQLKAKQCLVISPLKINGYIFEAGINGHMGVVVGDIPSYSDQFFARIFSSSANNSFLGGFVPILVDLFLPGADSGQTFSNPEEAETSYYPPVSKEAFDEWIERINNRTKTATVYSGNGPLTLDDRPNDISAFKGTITGSLIEQSAYRKYGNAFYSMGGERSAKYIDCSGFTQGVFADLGIKIPGTAQTQYDATSRIPDSELRPGDLVFKQYTYSPGPRITHVGIYLGNNQVIHAGGGSSGAREGEKTVRVVSFSSFKGNKYAGAGRINR